MTNISRGKAKKVPVTPLGVEAQLLSVNPKSKTFAVFRVNALAVPHYVFAENELLPLLLHFKRSNTSFLFCLQACKLSRLHAPNPKCIKKAHRLQGDRLLFPVKVELDEKGAVTGLYHRKECYSCLKCFANYGI